MIIKQRNKSLKISINEALLRRLPSGHSKIPRIHQDLAMSKAGLRGEEETDYYLRLLPEKDFYIIQGIRLQDKETIFQIDTLLLSPFFILIIEVKNYLGTVIFHPEFNQITRVYNGVEEAFEDPIIQAKRHQLHLDNWLKAHHLPPIPIEYLVAFGKSTTILKNPNNSTEVYRRVCLAGNLPFKIKNIQTRQTKEHYSEKEVKKLSKLLLKNDIPQTPTYSAYTIPTTEILTGIQCPVCSTYRMYRLNRGWMCPACCNLSKDAHVQALNDYFLLIKPTISNRQCQEFFHYPNPKMISKLLSTMELTRTGSLKNRLYHLPLIQ